MNPTVACIVVNWNNWQDTDACLTALALQTTALQVIVVDNASTNDSVFQLKQRHSWATFIHAGQNLGFAKACNLGARHAGSVDFFWFLNNDTNAPPDTLYKLVAQARTRPQPGIVGSVLYYFHAPHLVQAWGGGTINRWTGYSRHFLHAESLEPDSYLTFASVLVRRELFEQLQGLFEGAFMYFEDCDFCLRARAAGATLAVADTTAILHKEGGSQQGYRPQLDRVFTHAGILFMLRHSPVGVLGATLFTASRIAKRVVTLRFGTLKPIFQGIADTICDRGGATRYP